MTRPAATSSAPADKPAHGRWCLRDVKARFSELVRLARSDGPQRVTLHGCDAVVVIDAAEFERLQGRHTGQVLIDALQASPHRDIEIAPRRSKMPVRTAKQDEQ